ncbi:MAG: translation initiation factor [Saprospiraceae bacterium]|nr:translation initiation factor [Saprospiraceae bacterium]
MAKKKKKLNFYSTDPDTVWNDYDKSIEETLPVQQQKLRVQRDRKQRKGKEVTLITGYKGKTEDLKELGRYLKGKCGVGGTVKNNAIIIQGNHTEKIVELLKNLGYTQTKRIGG